MNRRQFLKQTLVGIVGITGYLGLLGMSKYFKSTEQIASSISMKVLAKGKPNKVGGNDGRAYRT